MTNMSTTGRQHTISMAAAIGLAALMVLVLPVGLAGAASAPSTSPTNTLWAYGAVESATFQGSSHGWQYSGNATYGYSVILNQTNTSATSFELTANRTMGVLFEVHYCYPTCHLPAYFGNVSYHVYETIDASANLSMTGTVDENGTAVPALALNNSESHLHANATESSNSYLPLDRVGSSRSHYASANVLSTTSVHFTPGLGLFPTGLDSAQSWNSSSQFVAHASADFSYFANNMGPRGSARVGPVTGNFSLPANGTVSVYGSYSPSDTVVLAGVSYPEVALRIVGPFNVREGFLLLPSATDMFDGGSQPWVAQQNGSASASMTYLDARASEGGHVGIGASAWVYDSSTINPNSTTTAVPGGTGIVASSVGSGDSAPATDIQGLPETVGAAQTQQGCLLTGAGCPAGGPAGTGSLRGLAGLVGIAVVVLVVAAVVVVIAERRRMPPPVYP
ncbi:MAG: hypothetical protein L3K02_09485, partial [Thermoplasmata archaeon]|nr:hypothetical protein [Thermoplasmata archaeon]